MQTIPKKIAKLARRHIGMKRCPEIRWDDVVRIEATGTDAFGAFEIWLTIHQSDGSQVTLTVRHKGYDRILESLSERFASIPLDWYDRMAEQPWHVESVLYAR